MPEVKEVFKKNLESRDATDGEQALINDRAVKGEPLFEEEREGYVAPEKEESKDEKEESEEKDEQQEENTEDKDAEGNEGDEEEDLQKTFDDADDAQKSDLIAELELDLESEEDKDKKKEMQETLDKWTNVEPKEEENVDAEIDAYAKEKEISGDEARELIEGRNIVRKKYGDDPKKLAHALRSLQGEYSKEKNAHIDTAKALDRAGLNSMMSSKIKPEDILKKPDGSKLTKEETIDVYREAYPGLTDGKEDDEVYDLQRQHVLRYLQQNKKDSQAGIKAEAKTKRVELLSNLPKDAESYKDSIKKMLDRSPDAQVANKSFDLKDMITWHKGRDTDKLVKEAEKRGYKRGLERRRIAGEIRRPSGKPKTNKDNAGASKSYGLSEDEKKTALSMYARDTISEKRKYELYADVLEHGKMLKKKKEERDKK